VEAISDHTREHRSLLASAEKHLLVAIARPLPRWLSSDHLTLLGLLSMPAAGLAFSRIGTGRWSATARKLAPAANWFGDSLDGYWRAGRDHQRPRHGYYEVEVTEARLERARLLPRAVITEPIAAKDTKSTQTR
jgi:hypothetical protein